MVSEGKQMEMNMTIKNGDMPAMPNQALGPDGLPTNEPEFGLTKREMMAMHIMASICVRYGMHHQEEENAALAVKSADALLTELERAK